MIVYVVGGEQRADAFSRPAWAQYRRAIVARVDTETGEKSVCLAVEGDGDSPPSMVFGASTLTSDRFYTCTKTEVHVYTFPAFRLLHRLSLPMFNDLHHVRPTPDGGVRVTVTGLDMVVECNFTGHVTQQWSVDQEEDPWRRFSPEVDYRKIVSTKPHRCHPNYSFDFGGAPWATRFEQGDAVCLTDRRRRMDLGLVRPHDGLVTATGVWFTAVDGRLIRVDHDSLRVDRELGVQGHGLRRAGWCRGLDLRDDIAVVGFSRLRWTQWPTNLSWLEGGAAAIRTLAHRPARIALVALRSGRILQEIELRDLPLSAIFSVHMGDR